MRAPRIIVFLVLSSALASVAYRFRLREYSLDEKVAASTLVVIVRASATQPPSKTLRYSTTELFVENVLKGKSDPTISLRPSGFHEEDPRCCVEGARYLMFLKKAQGGGYMSVNGPFGVYRLDVPKSIAPSK
jgi:hypothetical protein